jgi:Ion channel
MSTPFFFLILVRFARALWHSPKDPEFQALFFLVVVTLVTGAMFYRLIEGWSLLDSFYFSVVTLITIGYGDCSIHSRRQGLHHLLHIRGPRYHPGVHGIRWRSVRWNSGA